MNTKQILNSFSTHFELFFYINVFIFFLFACLVVITRLSLFNFPKLANRILFDTVVGLEVLMLAVMGYVYLLNYQLDSAVIFEDRVVFHTLWVKEKIPVFFIKENNLVQTNINGEGQEVIFTSESPIREYHFSPDGKYLLIVSDAQLYLIDRKLKQTELIDDLAIAKTNTDLKGVVRGVSWSPDSQKFSYELAKWSSYGSVNKLYVVSLADKKKILIENPAGSVSSLTWDAAGKNLYYTQFEAKDTSENAFPYEIKIFSITYPEVRPQLVEKILYDQPTLPALNLELRDIQLFTEAENLSFGRAAKKQNEWISEHGERIGIDSHDHLYYVKGKWWKKRLYRISRYYPESDIPRYHFGKGILTVDNLRWLPGGKYVIMEHHELGTLILDPLTGQIGQLTVDANGAYGWYK